MKAMKAILSPSTIETHCEPLTSTRDLADCYVAGGTFSRVQEEALAALGFSLSPELEEGCLRLERHVFPHSADSRGIAGQAIIYPWDFLALQERLLGEIEESRIEGDVSPGVTVEGVLILGKGSRVLPGVYIEGVVVIGQNCKIGPNCYLRGATSIGDGCRVGQAVEIKNSILYPNATVGHLSYCGDSIVGEKVNLGAGTIISNLRHDGKNHRSAVKGTLMDTGRRKFGTVIGDGVHTGIHTSIYPGRKLWPGTATRPGDVVQYDLMR